MRFLLSGSLFAFLLLLGKAVPAQPHIGIKIGYGLSMPGVTVNQNNDFWTPENKNGMVFGIFTQVPLQANWLFRPGLQFVSKGLREKSSNPSYSYSFPNHFSYLELPLNFVRAARPAGNGFLIGGGPAIGLLLNRNHRAYPLKPLDFGASVLMGYQTEIGFSAALTYTHGFVNVSDNVDRVPMIKNRFAAFTLGYLF